MSVETLKSSLYNTFPFTVSSDLFANESDETTKNFAQINIARIQFHIKLWNYDDFKAKKNLFRLQIKLAWAFVLREDSNFLKCQRTKVD